MEIELKLLLAPADVAVFRRLALLQQFAVDKPRAQKLSGTYFDTPELHLKKHGMELRVRRARAKGLTGSRENIRVGHLRQSSRNVGRVAKVWARNGI